MRSSAPTRLLLGCGALLAVAILMIVGPASALMPETAGPRASATDSAGFQAQLAQAKGAALSVRAERTELSSAQASATLAEAWTERFGSPPSPDTLAILTAQWSHETGDGKSMFNYNFAGIKGVGPSGLQVTQRTKEGYGAHEKVIKDGFRAYETALEGASDYLSLLSRKYSGALDAARQGDVTGFVDGLHQGGYFTGDKRAYERSVSRRAEALLSGPSELEPNAPTPLRIAYEPRTIEPETVRATAPLGHVLATQTRPEPRAPVSSTLHLETFTDQLALAALRIATSTEPSRG